MQGIEPCGKKLRPACTFRLDFLAGKAGGLLCCECKTVAALGKYMEFTRNLIFSEGTCHEKRVLNRNGAVLKGMPDKGRYGVLVYPFSRDTVSYIFSSPPTSASKEPR